MLLIDPFLKYRLGFSPDTSDEIVRKDWKKRTKSVCKPCWELKYCPYGLLVEQFPLPTMTREDAIEYNRLLKQQLSEGLYKGKTKRVLAKMAKEFDPNEYPTSREYPESRRKLDEERSCLIFGHICPVFFVNEPYTETIEQRRLSSHIPRDIMLKVVRRDGNICQVCGRTLADQEITFDHIIPLSKGGATEEYNLRVACTECNKRKGKRIDLRFKKR